MQPSLSLSRLMQKSRAASGPDFPCRIDHNTASLHRSRMAKDRRYSQGPSGSQKPSPTGYRAIAFWKAEQTGKLIRSHKHKRGLRRTEENEDPRTSPLEGRSHVWNVDGGGAGLVWRFCIENTGSKAY